MHDIIERRKRSKFLTVMPSLFIPSPKSLPMSALGPSLTERRESRPWPQRSVLHLAGNCEALQSRFTAYGLMSNYDHSDDRKVDKLRLLPRVIS